MGHFRFCIIWRSFNFLICKKRVTISTSKIVVRSNPIIIICLYTIILLLYLAHVMFWIGSRYWVNIMVVYSYYYYFCNTANDITWVLIMNFLRDFQWLIKRKNWRKIFTIWNFSWEFPWLFFLATLWGVWDAFTLLQIFFFRGNLTPFSDLIMLCIKAYNYQI